MTTPLAKPLKRELKLRGRFFIVTLSPASIKVVPKGKRNGLELLWVDLISGDAALATALNASVGKLAAPLLAPGAKKRQPIRHDR